ncbi:MAG: 7-cyano-7-deazaguanine synthase QueC [Andreesenia angusta]|nr:7-cyano-7-deazaguanine synthase QueC [Andreesenia angusta]
MVLFSGGVDSSTCLGLAIEEYGNKNIFALSIYYGQKHKREMRAAKEIANYYNVEHLELDLSKMFEYSNCSLLNHSDEAIPHKSYADQIEDEGDIVSTYVPFRNGLFLSTAASIALSKECSIIYYGAHADDSAGNAYPDCSEEFYKYMNEAIFIGSGNKLRLEAPFVNKNKADIVKKGIEIGVPYELTWSCYEGEESPCRQCGTCIDREKAFEINGIVDPLLR